MRWLVKTGESGCVFPARRVRLKNCKRACAYAMGPTSPALSKRTALSYVVEEAEEGEGDGTICVHICMGCVVVAGSLLHHI